MTKKIYLSLIFITAAFLFGALPATANDWGIFDNYEEESEEYALYNVINDNPINYYIIDTFKDDTENFLSEAELLKNEINKKQRTEEFKTLIQNAFNAWVKDTVNMINNEGRAEEFEDITSVLPTEVALQEVFDEEDADIVFIFTSYKNMRKECNMKASACFRYTNPRSIIVVNPYEEGLMSMLQTYFISTYHSLIHEIGHYYGLTDQYKDTGKNSLNHSTFNRMGKNEDAIMASNRKETLSCDDVDGFINLIDLTLALENGQFSPRASKEEGWASFCNGKKNKKGKYYKDEFYKNAQLLNKEPYNNGKTTTYFDEEGSWTYSNLNGY